MIDHLAVLVGVDGTVTAKTYDAINLDTLTEATQTRYVDCVQVRMLDEAGTVTLDAWVDDEGLINGSEPNPVASHMIAALSGRESQLLCGRILFTACDRTTGESIGLPQEAQKALVEMGGVVAALLARV